MRKSRQLSRSKKPRAARARLKRRHHSSARKVRRRRHRQPQNGHAAAQAGARISSIAAEYSAAKRRYHQLGDLLFAARGGNE